MIYDVTKKIAYFINVSDRINSNETFNWHGIVDIFGTLLKEGFYSRAGRSFNTSDQRLLCYLGMVDILQDNEQVFDDLIFEKLEKHRDFWWPISGIDGINSQLLEVDSGRIKEGRDEVRSFISAVRKSIDEKAMSAVMRARILPYFEPGARVFTPSRKKAQIEDSTVYSYRKAALFNSCSTVSENFDFARVVAELAEM